MVHRCPNLALVLLVSGPGAALDACSHPWDLCVDVFSESQQCEWTAGALEYEVRKLGVSFHMSG